MNPRPITISVITPSFNQAHFIRKTIESVIEQGLDGVEHFVMDGGSTDNTVEVLKEYPHLKWVSEKDRGQSDALNKGIARATGDVIVWINSDDVISPGAFDVIRREFARRPELMVLVGNTIVIDEAGRVIQHDPPSVKRETLLHPWVTAPNAFQPGVIFRRKVWETVGPIGVDLHYGMDYEYFLRVSDHFELVPIEADFGRLRVYRGTKTGDVFGPAIADIKKARLARTSWSNPLDKLWVTLRMHLYEGYVWICDAMRVEQQGHRQQARTLYRRALLRNPFSLFAYPHVCYRLQQLIGVERYQQLRTRFRKLRA